MPAKNETASRRKVGSAMEGKRSKQQAPSVIGEGIEIVGDLMAEAEIQVDGTVRGKLAAEHVIVGPTGLVDGSIKADSATIDGTVSGDTIAKTAALGANARIKGGVTVSGDMTMAAGARLDGDVSMK